MKIPQKECLFTFPMTYKVRSLMCERVCLKQYRDQYIECMEGEGKCYIITESIL